jgi:cobalt-zinc-cadmium efflux system outer membrane protein
MRRRQLSFVVIALVVLCGTLASGAVYGGDLRVTLPEAIALSLKHPRVLAARELVSQAQAEARAAALYPNPSLTGEVALLPLGKPYTVDEPGGPPELSAGVSYPVDWLLFGKRSAAIASGAAAVTVAEAEYADLLRLRGRETAVAFYGVLEAEALAEAAREALADMERAEAAIQRAVASGGRPQVELSRARLELQSARREDRSARVALLEAKAGLGALLGSAGPAGSLSASGTLDGPLAVKPLAVDAAFALASERRPDVLALRHRAAKAVKDEVLEHKNGRPGTAVGFGVARQFQEPIGAPNVTAWGVSLEIDLPLFDRNQGNRARARSAAIQADHEVVAALSELRAELEQAAEALEAARQNATDTSRTSLELAAQVRDAFRRAYEAGGRPLMELLDAERTYRETYQAYITSRAAYWKALSRYEAALGTRMTP